MPYVEGRYIGGIRPRLAPTLVRDAGSGKALMAAGTSLTRNRGLFLGGNVGTGKTTLLAEIDFWSEARSSHRMVRERGCRLVQARVNVWTDANEFCNDLKTWMDYPKSLVSSGGSAADCCATAYRLFLDDLGVERGTEFNTEAITNLLHTRYVRGLPTWISTNLKPSEVSARYGERTLSRIRETCITVELAGDDRRIAAPPQKLRVV